MSTSRMLSTSPSGFVLDLEGDIGDPHHLAALAVDDLLVEQIADHAQHVLVGMIGGELFVAEVNSVERNGADLIVADGQPSPAAAHQEAVDAGGMDQGNDGGVFDQAEPAALQVIDLEAQQFGEKEEFVRHRESPEPINDDPWSARSLGSCGFVRLRPTWSFSSTMPQGERMPQQKSSIGDWWTEPRSWCRRLPVE